MDKLCGERDCDFMLSLGDNFYWDGVYNIDDIRFNGTYENVYGFASERENIKNLDFYQILGNHDHRRNATAQVIYSHQKETNFKFPDLWYTFTIEKPKFSVKIIMIDTEIMMGNVKRLPEYPERDYQGEQQQWLDEELENCYADYCLVGGHHPVYSVGSHGPTPKIVDRLQPLLEKHHADAYLCGHDHNMQHFLSKRIHYFISGMGKAINISLENMNNELNPHEDFDYHSIFKGERLALLMIEANEEEMKFDVVTGRGNYFYPRTLRKMTKV